MQNRTLVISLAFAAANLVTATLPAQTPTRNGLVVNPAWLSAHVRDANLVVLQVGSRAAYDSAHITGARFAEMSALAAPMDQSSGASTRNRLELPEAGALKTALENYGISDNSTVVVVAGSGALTQSTRIMLTLDHAGFGKSSMWLDGGLSAWKKSGGAVTSEPTVATNGQISELRTRDLTVNADWVRENASKPKVFLVDARASDFFDGVQAGGPRNMQKKGHIPGARSVPFSSFATDDNELKSIAEIKSIFERAGARPGDTVVAYCHIGQQATATLFAARTLGYNVKLYDGSFEDWVRRGLPLEVPPGR